MIAAKAPALPLLAREFVSYGAMRVLSRFGPAVPIPIATRGHLILIIPGFMATDGTTARLRRSLAEAGHSVYGWGLGRNRGVTADMLDRIDTRVIAIQAESGLAEAPIVLGWSLGGLIAREYAKAQPEKVAKVVTMGSPFSGNIRDNNAWRAYEIIARHRVDNPPIETVLYEKPSVPTIAFWSARDGVVSPNSARGKLGEVDHQIELDCTHMAFVSKPSAITAIAEAITAAH
jgi:pimeloyl-ACP methyl ester carboxylesterase